MSTNTSHDSNTSKASTGADGAARAGLRTGEHVVTLQFSTWGPQEVTVRAYSNGGRGGAPYLIVGVGTCLTSAYDQAAVDAHVRAWEAAERMNRSVRLPEFAPTTASRRHAGEDLSVLCNVSAEQRHSVTSSTGPDGRAVITVTVGAVTVQVHTTTALRCYLTAWRKADTVTDLLEDARDQR